MQHAASYTSAQEIDHTAFTGGHGCPDAHDVLLLAELPERPSVDGLRLTVL